MLQIISFIVFIEINYSPVSKLFLQAIYQFTTFKIIPPEAMTSALQWLGMKEKQVEDDGSNKTFLENLNSMAIGAAGGLLIIIFIILGTLLMK